MATRTERRVRFTREFRWSPPERGGRVTLRFLAGKAYIVRAACARDAIAAGAAVALKKDDAP